MAQKMGIPLFLLAVISVLMASTTTGETAVPAIFIFGDSLADVGNNNNLPGISVKANFPHNGIDFPGGVPTGRFSNGYNGMDYLAKLLGFDQSPPSYLSIVNDCSQLLQGVNFASGGSGILDTTGPAAINFTTQIMNFENVTHALVRNLGNATYLFLSRSLFLISDGNNDLFNYYSTTGAKNIAENKKFITSLVDKLEDRIRTLYNLGARKFGILGLSQIGCVPFWRSRNPSEMCIKKLNSMAQIFNAAAKPRLLCLALEQEGMKYSYGNVFEMMTIFQATSRLVGLTELKTACCGAGKFNGGAQCTPNVTFCPNREDHLFWDWFHPTQATYKLVGTQLYNGSNIFNTPINIKQLSEI